MINEDIVIERNQDGIRIKGTTQSDLVSSIIEGGTVVEISGNQYLTSTNTLLVASLNKSYKPEIFRVLSRGDGYCDDTTLLVPVACLEEARGLALKIEEMYKQMEQEHG
ncbi:hypothetical protein HYT57_02760 [Candidatus Woesearchaeota archaeon]|nr:hypothetical protein [Candidatus Woesearchaeota archaeon]